MQKLLNIFTRLDAGQLMVVCLWGCAVMAILSVVMYKAISGYRKVSRELKAMEAPRQNRFKVQIEKESDTADVKDGVSSILFLAALFVIAIFLAHGR